MMARRQYHLKNQISGNSTNLPYSGSIANPSAEIVMLKANRVISILHVFADARLLSVLQASATQ